MRFYVKITLLLLSLNLQAQEFDFKEIPPSYFNNKVQVERENQEILLKGDNCELLLKEAQAIEKWANDKNSQNKVECKCVEGKGCSVDVHPIAP